MRTARTLLWTVLTLLVVAAGALLPWGTAAVQDRRLEESAGIRELDQVQMLIQRDMSPAQMLNLLRGEYTRVSWDAGASRTAEDALDRAMDLARQMSLENLLPERVQDVGSATAEPFLVLSGETHEALLLWECSWESLWGDVYTVWLDDATGRMAGFQRTSTVEFVDVRDSKTEKLLSAYMDQWAFFLQSYYDWEIMDSVLARETSGEDAPERWSLTLTVQDGQGIQGRCSVRLTLGTWNLSFPD